MNEEDVFHQAILTEPDDNVHRLIFADFLLEHDPAREPLVRLQGLLGPSVQTSLGQKLVPIPAGTFLMGSPGSERGRDPDETQHQVVLTKSFYLGATPVTVGEFRAFVEATAYETEGEIGLAVGWNADEGRWERSGSASWRSPGWPQASDAPVVCLSWADATAYCEWLSEKEDRSYRLPTEAEWEYACRAGTTTPFFFGEKLSAKQANIDPQGPGRRRPGVGQTTPVRSYPANAFGLFDMHGNAWEWCEDWYDYGFYDLRRKRDPRGPDVGNGRVLRGGSWYNASRDCRSALRRCGHTYFSRYADGNTGFRLALTMPKPPRKRKKVAQTWAAS